jgi:hypothetical protein
MFSISKLQQRDILFVGTNGVGKSFLINLIFLMTCVDSKTYQSDEFQNARCEIKNACKNNLLENDSRGHGSAGVVLHILHDTTSSRESVGLEALLDHIGSDVSVRRVDPIEAWVQECPDFARKFCENPAADQECLFRRFHGKKLHYVLIPPAMHTKYLLN